MLPRLTKFNVLEDMFNDPFFKKRESEIMKTDIKEKGDNYVLEIDIPGCDKKDIKIELNNGYLVVTASVERKLDEAEEKERYIRKERFYGKCSRSFYAGESITEEDVKASFKNGILTLTFPKEIVKEDANKKYIEISE